MPVLDAMDQPSIDGINTYFVSKAAAQAGMKVAISGLGGDELFGGYASFHQIPQMVKTLSPFKAVPFIGKGFGFLAAPILKHFTSPKYAGLLEYGGSYGGAYLLRRGMFMPWELPDVLDGDMVREGWKELQTLSRLEETVSGINNSRPKVSALETAWYMRNQLLRDADWASMAHSLEIRTPLVDWRLIQGLAPMLVSQNPPSKSEFARTPTMSLPKEVRIRDKTGFCVPVREWIMWREGSSQSRGLRGWAKVVYQKQSNAKRALVLVTDAYGGLGGIAKFNRDLLTSCAAHDQYEIIALPRLIGDMASEHLPRKLEYFSAAANGKLKYACALLSILLTRRRFEVVICGHINLLPLAWSASRIYSAPLVLIIHGIEAWQPTSRWLVNKLARKIDGLISVSATTRDRFLSWAPVHQKQCFILPNAVDLVRFEPRPKSHALLALHNLHGKTVIMTLGRLDSREAYKGIDQVLEVLPRLVDKFPRLVYLIAGSGSDVARLQRKTDVLKLNHRVIFAGTINETEKVDYYNLADAFVMPGRGEGFGVVYLEAMACGIPVVGSSLDGSKEALLAGKLGLVVNPDDVESLSDGIVQALMRGKGVPDGLKYFSPHSFKDRLHGILNEIQT